MSKSVKNVLSLVLCAVLLFGIAPLTVVQAADPTSGTCGKNLSWDYNAATNILTISGTGEMDNYSLDGSYNEGVWIPSAPWRPYCSTMKTLVIKTGVKSIGDYAFSRCDGLMSVTIPESVTSIGDCAFENCSGLTSVTIPDSVTNVGCYAFDGCTGLTSVTIGNRVTGIYEGAFYGCTGLTSITIPDSVTFVDALAFKNCSGLTSVIIPDSVTGIDDYAFYGCTGLTSVTIPASVTYIGDSAFKECSADLTIRGIPGSYAEIYANENHIRFAAAKCVVSIDDVTINYKDKTTLKPQINIGKASEYMFRYSSSNPDVVSVDEKTGEVYGAKRGTATITCTVTDAAGNSVSDTCKVTVKYTALQWIIKILLFGWIWY